MITEKMVDVSVKIMLACGAILAITSIVSVLQG